MNETTDKQETGSPATAADQTADQTTPQVADQTASPDGETVCAIAQDMLDAAGLDATATVVSANEDAVDLAIEGDDAGLLIGKQGQTLNSFQYLVGLIAARRLEHRIRVSVDAENYRARRADSLIRTAKDLAAQARAHNQEVVMDPLPAAERRIVHTALLEEPGISTYSEGDEPDRRVVISPKNE